ncbi:MAG: TrmH family RNA methyltransferase [Actinomycetota bacterium]
MTKPLSATDLKRLHRRWRRRTDLRLALILDGVQKPYNVGSLLRSAAAYNVETVWTVPPAPPVDHPTVAKTALGSDRFVQHRAAESGREALYQASTEGFLTVAIELTDDAVPLHEVETGGAVCLVLGHEDRGVHRDTLQHADVVAFLPQLGRIGSLNVAHAGTVALYEAARHAWTANPEG